MKFSISYPVQGTTKSFDIDDDNKCRVFFERRMGQEVEADMLGDQFKGYVFKIAGGFDVDGFAMKQGVFSNGRIRLLLSPGTKGYRATRKGERKRRSIRGCIVGPDIRMLSLILIKKGDKDIPGLTDVNKPRRLGPKRSSRIRKLYGIEKKEGEKTSNSNALIKKNVIRRTFKSKKNPEAAQRQKAPKIQRLVTDIRLRRKKVAHDSKVARWKVSQAASKEYQKLYQEWVNKKKTSVHEAIKAERAEKVAQEQEKKAEKPKEVKKDKKKDEKKPVAAKDKKVDAKKTYVKKTEVKKTDAKKDTKPAKEAPVKGKKTEKTK